MKKNLYAMTVKLRFISTKLVSVNGSPVFFDSIEQKISQEEIGKMEHWKNK